MNVILYSTKCPKCNVLETKLKEKNIDYKEVNDVDIMQAKGFEFMPMLEVDGIVYDFKEAVKWIGAQ
jgi:glutaredoxin-related protein